MEGQTLRLAVTQGIFSKRLRHTTGDESGFREPQDKNKSGVVNRLETFRARLRKNRLDSEKQISLCTAAWQPGGGSHCHVVFINHYNSYT
jgi:hypothetical protein